MIHFVVQLKLTQYHKTTTVVQSLSHVWLCNSVKAALIKVATSACMKLLFLLATLIPACELSRRRFCMMCSAYKLNKQGDNITALIYSFPNFFSFIFISWRLITLQYCSGFCYTLKLISHGFTCVPHPWSPLPPPSPSHPSGSSQCTSPEHLSHASNLGWWSVSP